MGILSSQSVLKELAIRESLFPNMDILELLETYNVFMSDLVLSEAEYNDTVKHLQLEIADVERFVKVNDVQRITNPITYVRNGVPSDDGLLSYKIFGITKDDRAGIFGYIDLDGWYMDPSCYKTWVRMDNRIKGIVHRITKYRIDENGELIEDEKGETGIEFLRKNMHRITFKSTDSVKRDIKIQYLLKNRDRMFIRKYLVIPPFYRDGSINAAGGVSVGGINKLYANLLQAVNGKSITQDYGFDASGAADGRIQETLLNIYDWFVGNSTDDMKVETGAGISGKKGILRRANMSKTSNYASRMVITAPELKVEHVDDMMVNMEYSSAPLAAVITDFRPFVMFNVKRFFENEFIGTESYPVMAKDGKIEYMVPKDPLVEFSDERIKREMDRFLHGYNNRFVPIEVPVEGSDKKIYMQFKGRFQKVGDNPESIYHRRLTWCDVFYMAAVEAVRDKYVLITRFPIDSYFNQIATKVRVSSTNEMEPIYVGDTYYPYYPKIREEDIGTNTGNKFVDTMKLSNLYLPGLGGDYDGDTVSMKGVYTIEANEEIEQFVNSNRNFIDLGGRNIRKSTGDVIQSIYSFTKVLGDTKLTTPEFA